MANTKISDFTSGAPAQSGDEFVIARSGANFKLAGSDIKTLVVGAGSVSVASAKTLTASNTLTLAGTDGTTMTFPSTSATLARTDAANTFTGGQTISGGTLNGTVLNVTQTWGGTGTYTGLQYNVTDSGPSNAASLLMDLQVGGASSFSVRKDASIHMYPNGVGDTTNRTMVVNNNGLSIVQGGVFGWGSAYGTGASGAGGAPDAILSRRGAANLRFGAADAAAPVAQTLSVQSVVAGTTNTAGANLTITGSQGTGTGAGGSIIFQVAPAGSSGTAQNALATFLEATSARSFNLYNTVDVTTNFERGFFRWDSNLFRLGTESGGTGSARNIEFFTAGTRRLVLGGNGLFILLDASANGTTFITNANGLVISNVNNNDFGRLQFGGTTSSFPAIKRSTTFLQARLADDSAFAGFAAANVQAATAYTVATLPGTPGTGMIARVTDATAPVIGATVAGGGAAYALVNYNGANWTVIGV